MLAADITQLNILLVYLVVINGRVLYDMYPVVKELMAYLHRERLQNGHFMNAPAFI